MGGACAKRAKGDEHSDGLHDDAEEDEHNDGLNDDAKEDESSTRTSTPTGTALHIRHGQDRCPAGGATSGRHRQEATLPHAT